MSKIDIFAGQLGIRIIRCDATKHRWQTTARQTLRRLYEARGEGHLALVLKAIKARPENAMLLTTDVITAVSDVLAAFPALEDRGGELLDQFERIDLHTMRHRAVACLPAGIKVRHALFVGLVEALRPPLPEAPPVRGLLPTRQQRIRKRSLEMRRAA